ncbi:MAG: hypothetical protein JSS23_00065 [Proteobacteria bacterium]|nr:hypothetical protein [Pseudomonadota bacterium]
MPASTNTSPTATMLAVSGSVLAGVTAALGRLRYGRQEAAKGYRNGHLERELEGTVKALHQRFDQSHTQHGKQS